jgi:uncharacterized protein YjbJ (UPF0337 family)
LAHRVTPGKNLGFGSLAPVAKSASTTIVNQRFQEHTMNKNRTGGLLDEARGRAKEVTDKPVGNKPQEPKNKVQPLAGNTPVIYGDIKESFKLASKYK